MKKHFQPFRLQVSNLHPNGYCLAADTKTGGANIGVFGAIPGEVVTAMPFTRRQGKIFARTTTVHEAATTRVKPPCAVADVCGGCSLQHISPPQQIAYKQQQLSDLFAEIEPETWYSPLIGDVRNYRRKARLGARYVAKKGRVLVGFREKMQPFITDTPNCAVLHHSVSQLFGPLARLLESVTQPETIPQIEIAVGDDSKALVLRHLQPLTYDDITRFKCFARQYDIGFYLQPGGFKSTHQIYPENNLDMLTYTLPAFDLHYRFHPLDFIQVHHGINQQMVTRTLDLLAVQEQDRVMDAFCGIGNFSLAIACHAGLVIGMDVSRASIKKARENADNNNISNVTFEVIDLFVLDAKTPQLPSTNKVLLDPPRSGAESLCKQLTTDKVEKVVYVSCNPATLVRDAKILVVNGFQFKGAGMIDMFPHTTHVETIACFSR